MPGDVDIRDVELARATALQVATSGRRIIETAKELLSNTIAALADVKDQAKFELVNPDGRSGQVDQYCAALTQLGMRYEALGNAACRIIDDNVRTDQEAAMAIRSRTGLVS